MTLESDKLKKNIERLFKKRHYDQINVLLTDSILQRYKDVELLIFKGQALLNTHQYELASKNFEEALVLKPNDTHIYLLIAEVELSRKELSKAAEIYKKILVIDEKSIQAHIGLGRIYSEEKNFLRADDSFKKAIELDKNFYYSYYCRGYLYLIRKEFNKAFKDLVMAIRLYPRFAGAYVARAHVWSSKGELQKAIKDLNKAIEIDNTNKTAYYNRASIFSELEKYSLALNDYIKFVSLETNSDDYLRQVAVSEIDQLNKKLANTWYDEIDKLLVQIKKVLLFEKECLTHYTSMSAAREMILNESLFRISEGAFLNDTSEGRELFNFLSFSIQQSTVEETISELFIERPFIGSFVADTKHNDLALWRMYGKEAEAEAKGCALTIYRQAFLNNIETQVKTADIGVLQKTGDIQSDTQNVNIKSSLEDLKILNLVGVSKDKFADTIKNFLKTLDQTELSTPSEKFTFYNVAYRSKEEFLIPGSNEQDKKRLNTLLTNLKDKIALLTIDQKVAIAEKLNDIAYLFKSAEYQYEQEVRLVVQGVGIAKKIDTDSTPPRVYIELGKIEPVLHKITLGPKVEKADEWAAAFNYFIEGKVFDRKQKVEIVISHLPFK